LVFVAAVGPRLTQVAGEMADGLLVHTFMTSDYLREETLPALEAGLRTSGRSRSQFQVSYPALVVTGRDEDEYRRASNAVKRQIAFYGSTPAYLPVLEKHGWGDLHAALHGLSKQGEWRAMTKLVDDEVVAAFAVAGAPSDVGRALRQRFGDLVDRVTLSQPYSLEPSIHAEIVAGLRAGH
jgi:probable F420-dependent oxidoreductase